VHKDVWQAPGGHTQQAEQPRSHRRGAVTPASCPANARASGLQDARGTDTHSVSDLAVSRTVEPNPWADRYRARGYSEQTRPALTIVRATGQRAQTRQLRRVAGIDAASHALGHSDLSTTLGIYGHRDASDLESAMEAYGEYLEREGRSVPPEGES